MIKLEPMSDIGRALASAKDGEFHLKKLNGLLDNEMAKVEAKIRKGLDKAGFVQAEQQKMAVNSAKLVLKSIHLYHSVK